mmetsp:Transcript_11808/g.29320  ORF Transcript_11808/g.29320 Transcript_11808/m.29320 type:complete len:254 (-) Transcript_11808:545-1306(-)
MHPVLCHTALLELRLDEFCRVLRGLVPKGWRSPLGRLGVHLDVSVNLKKQQELRDILKHFLRTHGVCKLRRGFRVSRLDGAEINRAQERDLAILSVHLDVALGFQLFESSHAVAERLRRSLLQGSVHLAQFDLEPVDAPVKLGRLLSRSLGREFVCCHFASNCLQFRDLLLQLRGLLPPAAGLSFCGRFPVVHSPLYHFHGPPDGSSFIQRFREVVLHGLHITSCALAHLRLKLLERTIIGAPQFLHGLGYQA